MGARHKLDLSYFTGSLLLAALIGLLGQSWAAFNLALLCMLALNLAVGEIRPGRRRDR
jgi:hypothetical protein